MLSYTIATPDPVARATFKSPCILLRFCSQYVFRQPTHDSPKKTRSSRTVGQRESTVNKPEQLRGPLSPQSKAGTQIREPESDLSVGCYAFPRWILRIPPALDEKR